MSVEDMSFRTQVLLSLQRALWGLIPPCLRAVAVGWEGGVARARFVFDHEPDADDLEAVSDVEGYVIGDFAPGQPVEITVDVDPAGPFRHLPHEGWWAYVRREESNPADETGILDLAAAGDRLRQWREFRDRVVRRPE
jgi:hypothetical protein